MAISNYLYLLRHAKSSWDEPTLADHERPLSPRGRRAAQLLAKHFVSATIRPEVIFCSSATRARETLAPITAAMGLGDRVQIDTGLYGATAEQILVRLRTVDQDVTSVLVVGHNPGLQDLALELSGDDPDVGVRVSAKFPTGALAVVVMDAGSWAGLSSGTAHLASLTVPRELPS